MAFRHDKPTMFMSQKAPSGGIGFLQIEIHLSCIGKEKQSQVCVHLQLFDRIAILLVGSSASMP